MSRSDFYALFGGLALVFGLASGLAFGIPMADASSAARPDHRTLAGEARAKEVARKVDLLADMGYGLRVHKVKPGKGEDMVLALASEDYGLTVEDYLAEERFHVLLLSKDIAFGDMIGWGTMNLDVAQDLFASSDDSDALKEARRAGFGQVLLKELSEMSGISFGFTDGSSSYCGMSFMGLLVVDEENGVIYEVSLTGSGEC